MPTPIEKLEAAVEEFISDQNEEGQQHMLTGFVLSYEALDMAEPEMKMFRSSYASGGPSNTPAQSLGLLKLSQRNIEQDIFGG